METRLDRNAAGYYDPTAYKALTRITQEEKKMGMVRPTAAKAFESSRLVTKAESIRALTVTTERALMTRIMPTLTQALSFSSVTLYLVVNPMNFIDWVIPPNAQIIYLIITHLDFEP